MKLYKILAVFVAFLTISGGFTACKKSSFGDTPSQVSLYQIISDDFQFSMFKYAVDRAGLQDMLNNSGSDLTLIVPTNFAFSDMGFGQNGNATLPTLEKMTNEELAKLVKNHLLSGKVELPTANGTTEIITLNRKIKITRKGEDVYVNGGDITHLGVNATNGRLYVLNRVILSEQNIIQRENVWESLKARTGNFSFLVALITRASTAGTNYVEMLSGQTPYTLFALDNTAFTRGSIYPTVAAINAAPAAELSELLSRHILPGTKLTSDLDSLPVNTYSGAPAYLDREKFRTGEILYTLNLVNGVIFSSRGWSANSLHANGSVFHMVTQILPKPVTTSTLQYIKSEPNLTYFDAAVDEATKKSGATINFIELLSSTSGSYTVYAPTNDAFAEAGYNTIADVRALPIGTLTNMLRYHIAKRRMARFSLAEGSNIPTLLTTIDASKKTVPVTFSVSVNTTYSVKGKINTTASNVVTADVVTTTGLVNTIGSILRSE